MRIPAPPSHWVNDLQKSTEFGRLSGLTVVRPVVVNPDTDSNKASADPRWYA